MQLRVAPIKDMASADALLAHSYPALLRADYPASVLVTALPLISRAQPDLFNSGTYYVVEKDGQMLGCGGWTRDRRDTHVAHIRHLVTDRRHLRRGVARRIVSHSLDAAVTVGITEMRCASTLTARLFYEALGFRATGPMEVPLRPGISFPAVAMTRSI